ncbi:hypothetical protein ACFQH6_15880 [Halobacteriaceae archaeon GCM10025711]
MGWLGHGVRVTRVEVTRNWRSFVGNRRRILLLLGMLVLFSPSLYFLFRGVYAFGVSADRAAALAAVRQQVTPLSLLFTAVIALRVVEAGRLDNEELLLTTTGPRAVVFGIVGTQFLQGLAYFLLPIVAVSAAFAVGAGTPALLVTVPVFVAPLFAAVTLLGYVVGTTVSITLTKVAVLRRLRRVVGLVFFLVILGLAYALPYVRLPADVPLTRAAMASPLDRYADLFFLGTSFAPAVDATTLGVAAAVVAAVPALFLVAERLGPVLWYADEAGGTSVLGRDRPQEEETEPTVPPVTATRASRPPGPFARSTAGHVAWVQWVRGLREPTRFTHLTYLLFVMLPGVTTLLTDPGAVLTFGPPFVVVLGVFLAGASFGLNPLGDEGRVLPVLVTSGTTGRAFVRGRMLAGLVVGVPVILVAGVVGLAGPLPAWQVAAVAGFGLVLAPVSVAVAVGIGAFAPRFEAVRSYGGVETVTPRTLSILGHTTVVGLLAGVSVLVVFLPSVAGDVGVGSAQVALVQAGALAVVAAVLGGVGVGAYRYAVRRFDAYRVD